MKLKVAYITYPWFLDLALEYISALSKEVDLYVFVLSQKNRRLSTIYSVSESFEHTKKIEYSYTESKSFLLDHSYYAKYIEHCKSFRFYFFPNKWYTLKNIRFNKILARDINELNVDLIHLDDLTIEMWPIRWFLKKVPFILNVHDPLPHSGEKNIKRVFSRYLYFEFADCFVTYSEYSRYKLLENYDLKKPVINLGLVPYTFYLNYIEDNAYNKYKESKYILFIGRVSKYKGIEDLLEAFKQISLINDRIKLIIAGKNAYKYAIPKKYLDVINVSYINRFIDNEEMARLVSGAEFIVCPYKDATQSGVTMTAFAFKKRVLVSSAGGLSEVVNDSNGQVFNVGHTESLFEALNEMIDRKESKDFVVNTENTVDYNVQLLVETYTKFT